MNKRQKQDEATRQRAEESRVHFDRLLQVAKDAGKLEIIHIK